MWGWSEGRCWWGVRCFRLSYWSQCQRLQGMLNWDRLLLQLGNSRGHFWMQVRMWGWSEGRCWWSLWYWSIIKPWWFSRLPKCMPWHYLWLLLHRINRRYSIHLLEKMWRRYHCWDRRMRLSLRNNWLKYTCCLPRLPFIFFLVYLRKCWCYKL